MWFDELPVFGFSADEGRWIHPSADCGRDEVPVPAASSERHAMWNCLVESRSQRMPPEVGSKHPCGWEERKKRHGNPKHEEERHVMKCGSVLKVPRLQSTRGSDLFQRIRSFLGIFEGAR